MEEIFFSITYPPIPITKVGPVFLSLHGVFAAIGFYFGASHALKLSEQDGANSILFSEALTWAIFGAIQTFLVGRYDPSRKSRRIQNHS